MAEDIIRALRVIEYVGPRSEVERHIRECVHGIKVVHPDDPARRMEIRAATIGLVPDILEMGRVEELLPPI